MMRRRGVALFLLAVGLTGVRFAAPAAADDAAVANGLASDTTRALQQQILADPDLTARAMALRDDPEVRAVLDDPAIAAALANGDTAALLADPRIQRLADNPAVRDVTRSVTRE